MRLLAQGRDAEIYDLGDGRVLRKAVMAHAHAAGVPVPFVHDVTADGAIVMDRVDGPTLLAELLVAPEGVDEAMRILVELHDRVHAVTAPADLKRRSLPGDRLLHLDLHVLNVIRTADGPVLIDWTNAIAGPPEADLAMTWIAHSSVTAADVGLDDEQLFRRLQRRMSESLLALVDPAPIAAMLPDVVTWRLEDPSVSAAEAVRVRALSDSFPELPS
jgi:aminoglycoside phosphotransferase (APT) family kinase protein